MLAQPFQSLSNARGPFRMARPRIRSAAFVGDNVPAQSVRRIGASLCCVFIFWPQNDRSCQSELTMISQTAVIQTRCNMRAISCISSDWKKLWGRFGHCDRIGRSRQWPLRYFSGAGARLHRGQDDHTENCEFGGSLHRSIPVRRPIPACEEHVQINGQKPE